MYKESRKLISLVAIVAFISGCSSTLRPEIDKDKLNDHIKENFDEIYNQPLPEDPMTQGMAVAYTLHRNLDIKVKEIEQFIEKTKSIDTFLKSGPELIYERDYRHRNKLALSTSERLNADGTVQEIDEVDTLPSYSTERDIETTSLTFQFDLLNLWQYYYDRNIHKANVNIKNRNRIKAAQNVTVDAVENFKLAQIEQSLRGEFTDLLGQMNQLKSSSCSVIGTSSSVKDKLLRECRNVVNNSRQLARLKKQLYEAKINFSATISAHPGNEVLLAPIQMKAMPKVNKSLDDLIDIALQNSTELEIERFKYIIAKNEQYKAWTDIFPSVLVGVSYNTDDNRFLVNDSWTENYVTINWNVIKKIISAPYRARTAKYEAMAASDVRTKTAIVTLATKVALAIDAYNSAVDQWDNSNKLALISRDEYYKADAQSRSGRISSFKYANAEKEMLVSKLQSMVDYASLWGAAARLYGALGVRIIPDDHNFTDYTLSELSEAFDAKFKELGISG